MRPLKLSDPVHFTNLRNMSRSAAHYAASIEEPREPSFAMRFGTISHAILFGEPFVKWPKRRAGKDWEAFAEEHANDLIVTLDEHERALRIVDAVTKHRDSARILRGAYEVDRSWNIGARACAGRLDVLGDGFVSEFKTCSNAHPQGFVHAGMRMGYHAQLAWYLDGVGMPDGDAYIVACETAPPYATTCFQLTPRALDQGRRTYRLWLEQLLACEASGEFPAYCQSIVPFDVPDDSDSTLIIDGEEVAA